MKSHIRLKAMSWQFLLVLLIVSVTGYVSVLMLTSDQEPSLASPQMTVMNAHEVVQAEEKPQSVPIWQVYKDPKTGQFRRPPAGAFPGEELFAEPGVQRDTPPTPSLPELKEFMSPVLGGGIVTKVRLRFRRPLVATRDGEGNLKIQHMPQEADLNGEQ